MGETQAGASYTSRAPAPLFPVLYTHSFCQLHPSTPQFTQVMLTWVPEDGPPPKHLAPLMGLHISGFPPALWQGKCPQRFACTLSGTRKGPKVWIQPPQDPSSGDLCPASKLSSSAAERNSEPKEPGPKKHPDPQHSSTLGYSIIFIPLSDGIPG